MKFRDLWVYEKSKLRCDIMLVKLGDHYNAYYSDAKRLYHDFDFSEINRLNGEIFSATITEQKLFSVIDYYKSQGITAKILSEGK